ncbi:response regulator [Segetibacter aerophilus]|uniref:histidine kinase n=1 Tax=Segetibacter aerophilus TaxID=670293 RepID=A0A512BGS9_9BACT|nr:response regulator [Segetibacter aerophilus]GEO11176.1 hypothetical protein SAE01_36720 [Segetibacter aerophilus]
MKDRFKILHLEDVASDAELVARTLRRHNFLFDFLVIDTEQEFIAALDHFSPDVILCDHSLPAFNSFAALKIIKDRRLNIPFIVITATMSEDVAMTVVREGADDYVLKDRLNRLPFVVSNAIDKYRFEKDRKRLIDDAHQKEALAKSKLQNLSDKLLLATQAAGIGIWEYEIEQNKFIADDLLLSLYGTSTVDIDITLEIWLGFLHPKDKERVVQEFSMALQQSAQFASEYRIIWNDGSVHFIKSVAHIQYDEAGRPIRLIGTNQDITASKLAEIAIKESEERYRAFFENSMDGILITVTDGHVTSANPAACAMFQMTEAEICKAGRFGLVDTTDERLPAGLEQRELEGKVKGVINFLRKDGSRFPGEITSSVYGTDDGEKRTSMIIRDVTERKKADEQILNTSLELKRALTDVEKIMDSSLDIICSIDNTGRFVTVSSAANSIWGYEPCELKGALYMDLVYPADEKITLQAARDIVQGNAVTMFENRCVKKDGSIVPMLWSARWDDDEKTMYCIAKDGTEKKRMEAAYDSEQQRLQELFLHAPASVGVFKGSEHVFEMANEPYLQLTGRKDIIGKTVLEVFPEMENQGLLQLLDEVFTSGVPFTANERLVQVDINNDRKLENKYLNFVYHPYRNSKNLIEGVFFFAVDVTEQVEARKRIEESEKRVRQLIENLPEAVYTCDAEGKIELYNNAAVKLWGREPVIGKDYWSGAYKTYYINGSPILPEEGPMASTLKNGKGNFEFEVIIEHPNGEKRFARANPIPLFDNDKKLVGAVNMIVDITHLKLVEEKLRTSNERYQIVTKATNDGIWDWNLLTNEMYWNKSYERIFGYKNVNQNLDAEQWFDKIHIEDRERVKNGFSNVINNGGMLWEDEYRYLKADGEIAIVYDRGYLIYNDVGKATRFVGAMEDITQRKKIENEREYLIEHLVKSNNDLKQFTYITSHNFRAPLSNLIGLLSLIDRSTLTENNREIVKMFEVSTNQLNKTINDLVQILIIKNNLNVNIVNNNITNVLNDVCSSLGYEIAEIDCTINRNILVENIVLNKSYLESILINLLSNSIKYRSPARKLVIDISTTKKATGEVVLVIKDNGSGINMKRHKEQIFGLYQRFHAGKEGVGLGLYMVKTQIMALGGKIEVQSEEDKGTEFYITFKSNDSLLLC